MTLSISRANLGFWPGWSRSETLSVHSSMCPKSHYVIPANIRAHASVPGRLARAPRQRGALAFWCGGDGAVSLKRRSYCDLLCGASARACLAEAGDPAAFRKLWDFAVTCAHRPTTQAADVDIREFFFVVRLEQGNIFGGNLEAQKCSVPRSRIGRSAVFDSSRVARVSHSFLLFFFFSFAHDFSSIL